MHKRKGHPTCCLRSLDKYPLSLTQHDLPPSESDIVTQYRLQKAKSESISAQKNALANIDFITEEQQNVRAEIESLKTAVRDLEFLISSSQCKTIHPKKLSDLCKVKTSLRVDLSNAEQQDKRLQRHLHEARVAYRNAKIEDHIVNEDIKKFKNKSWDKNTLEKSISKQRRIEKEVQCKKNAISAREQTISSVANSITVHVLQKLPGEHNVSQKRLLEAKSARQNISKYVTQSLLRAREIKAVTLTEAQIRQRRQKDNLARLKRDMNEIKKTLAVKSHLKRIHDEEIAVEKEEVKGLLKAQGANPYLAEYLLAIEEKQREVQRKMLVEEQKRLLDMQREYSTIEASKAKEESDRKKWEQYWSKKAMDRLMSERRSKLELYFDFPGDEEEHDQIKSELQMKVAEQLNERLSQSHHALLNHLHMDDDDESEGEEEENQQKPRKSRENSSEGGSESGGREEPGLVQFKPQRQSVDSFKSKKKISMEGMSTRSKGKGMFGMSPLFEDGNAVVEASLRKAIHLEDIQKESLLRMAGTGENTKAILMNGRNVFDFGTVPVGQRKYIMVNVANIGIDPVQLKMSVLNPYGPFTFCNSLKEIPQDCYFSLKFKYQPTDSDEESQETIKIEEVGKPENYIIIKLKGCALGMQQGEE